jgi:hypothetical protein
MRILVATNNFWLGGRETFVTTWLEQLPGQADLIATLIDRDVPGLELFGSAEQCGAEPYAGRWQSWLTRGAQLIERSRPDVIWAQHFELLPAWLLSQLHGIPLLTTFHGPLLGAGRPNDLMQALGMTLAVHRGDAVTGVSEEILGNLRSLDPKGEPHLLPNTVAIAGAPLPRREPPRNFVLLTRRDKLEHIRQSALLFATYAKRVSGCRLVIADGEMKFKAKEAGSLRAALRQLGGRWTLAQGPGFLRSVPRVHFIGWTAEARRHIREADVVLGMGRVVLEGLAENRLAVLVGYKRVHGLITPENFDAFRHANFSGRGMPEASAIEVTRELRGRAPEQSGKRDLISAQAWAPKLRALLEETATRVPQHSDLAQAIQSAATEEDIFRVATRSLSDEELATLYRVSAG